MYHILDTKTSCCIDFMIDTMDLQISKPHIERLNLRGESLNFRLKVCKLEVSKSPGELPPEGKRYPDPFQDIHFSPFLFLLTLTSLQRLRQYGPTG